jgi:predicted  nucleic acid-binding Zn-ribbon protein
VSGAAPLLRLQEVDNQIAMLKTDIAEVRAALRSDPKLDRQRAEARRAAEDSARAASDLAAGEQELATLDRRTKTLDRKLYDGSVHNPSELLEMQRELEVLRIQLGDVEDRLLELIDADDAATSGAHEAEAKAAQLENERSDQEAPRRGRLEEREAKLEDATRARETIAGSLGARELALYSRVASRRQPAVASIKGDACGGCHLPLSNEERRAVRAGDSIVQCSNCDRILVP